MSESTGGGVRELLAVFGLEVDDSGLKKGESGLASFGEKVKKLTEAFAAAFLGKELFEFGEGQAKAMHAVERTATALGISTERVQQLQFAAKSLGEDGEFLTNILGRLQVSTQKVGSGADDTGKAFAALGVHVKDANGHTKAADELLLDVADGISKMTDPAKQAAAATQLFGRSGRELLPFLKEGSAHAKEMFQRYKELGGGYTKEAMEAGKEFEGAQAGLNQTFVATKNTIAAALLPILTKLTAWATKAVKWFNDLTKNSNIFQASLFALGVVGAGVAASLVIAFEPLILVVAGIAAAFAAVVLIVDDLMTLFEGGDSEIGDIIDKIFGKGASTATVKALKEIWHDLKEEIGEAWQNLKGFVDKLEQAGKWTAEKAKGIASSLGIDTAADFSNNGSEANADGTGKLNKYNAAAVLNGLKKGTAHWVPEARLPAASAGMSIDQSVGDITINQSLPPGMSPGEVGAQTRKAIDDALKQRNRSAAANLRTAPAQ